MQARLSWCSTTRRTGFCIPEKGHKWNVALRRGRSCGWFTTHNVLNENDCIMYCGLCYVVSPLKVTTNLTVFLSELLDAGVDSHAAVGGWCSRWHQRWWTALVVLLTTTGGARTGRWAGDGGRTSRWLIRIQGNLEHNETKSFIYDFIESQRGTYQIMIVKQSQLQCISKKSLLWVRELQVVVCEQITDCRQHLLFPAMSQR